MLKYKTLFLVFLTMALTACDEGRIFDDATKADTDTEARNLTLHAKVMGVSGWPSAYTVSVAAFEDGNDYALMSKSLGSAAESDENYDVTLTNIPVEATSIEICAVDKLRHRVASFSCYSLNSFESPANEIFEEKIIDASMFGAIQNSIFSTTCANCHGKSNFAAAGLFLTDDKSYNNLVNVVSQVEGEQILRVNPGNRTASLLYLILAGSMSANWQYDHSVEVVDEIKLELIGSWIDSGAQP